MLIGLAIFTNIYTGPSMKSIHQSNSLNSFSRIPLYSCCERKAAFSIRPQNPRMKPRGTVIEARLNPFEKWTRRNISAFLPRGAFAVVPTSHRFPLVRFFFSPCDAKLIILSSLSSSIYLSTINAPHVTTVSPLSLSLDQIGLTTRAHPSPPALILFVSSPSPSLSHSSSSSSQLLSSRIAIVPSCSLQSSPPPRTST